MHWISNYAIPFEFGVCVFSLHFMRYIWIATGFSIRLICARNTRSQNTGGGLALPLCGHSTILPLIYGLFAVLIIISVAHWISSHLINYRYISIGSSPSHCYTAYTLCVPDRLHGATNYCVCCPLLYDWVEIELIHTHTHTVHKFVNSPIVQSHSQIDCYK